MIFGGEVLQQGISVLFLCTGNYYRSRYAEVRLENWAKRHGLTWQAESRGLAVDFEQKTNKGPMSPFAISRLSERGIDPSAYLRMPQDLTVADLAEHPLRIAVDRTEHVPMLERRFPDWVDHIEYWNVADGNPTDARHPLAEIDQHLETLFDRLMLHG
ncbi:MAG: low molecular weight phosphatase family protein [Myxococcota bacterium]